MMHPHITYKHQLAQAGQPLIVTSLGGTMGALLNLPLTPPLAPQPPLTHSPTHSSHPAADQLTHSLHTPCRSPPQALMTQRGAGALGMSNVVPKYNGPGACALHITLDAVAR